jgi:organic hydroperoxide reductase OsmC/OhrA
LNLAHQHARTMRGQQELHDAQRASLPMAPNTSGLGLREVDAMPKQHSFRVNLDWTGNTGAGTAHYGAYLRDHEISGAEKVIAIPGSSDPAFRGDPRRYSPEELLVASLSSCHMLWMLHLCASAGIVVTDYRDEASGSMAENADGSGQFTEVVLRPRLVVADPSRVDELPALHERAHALCFISRSVNFAVRIVPLAANAVAALESGT